MLTPSCVIRVCFFLLTCNIFVACPDEKQPATNGQDAELDFGTYNLIPQNSVFEKFSNLPTDYRLISFQGTGYWISTDTGMTCVVSGTGKITEIDRNDTQVSEYSKVFATANGEVWQIGKTSIGHSKVSATKEMPSEIRVLWFGENKMLAYGKYKKFNGEIGKGFQVIFLNNNNNITIRGGSLPARFDDADKYVSGGMLGERNFWLWTRKGGLMAATYNEEEKKYVDNRTKIFFPKIARPVKDLGFYLTIANGNILPPTQVLAIVAGEKNIGKLHTAN